MLSRLLTTLCENTRKMAERISDASLEEKDYDTALRAQTVCVLLFPNARNYSDRAEIHDANEDPQAAVADYTESLKYYKISHTYAGRAKSYKKLGKNDCADQDIKTANRLLKEEYKSGKFTSMPPLFKL